MVQGRQVVNGSSGLLFCAARVKTMRVQVGGWGNRSPFLGGFGEPPRLLAQRRLAASPGIPVSPRHFKHIQRSEGLETTPETTRKKTAPPSVRKGRSIFGVARPERFELPAPRFVVLCSIQLSYGRNDIE